MLAFFVITGWNRCSQLGECEEIETGEIGPVVNTTTPPLTVVQLCPTLGGAG